MEIIVLSLKRSSTEHLSLLEQYSPSSHSRTFHPSWDPSSHFLRRLQQGSEGLWCFVLTGRAAMMDPGPHTYISLAPRVVLMSCWCRWLETGNLRHRTPFVCLFSFFISFFQFFLLKLEFGFYHEVTCVQNYIWILVQGLFILWLLRLSWNQGDHLGLPVSRTLSALDHFMTDVDSSFLSRSWE